MPRIAVTFFTLLLLWLVIAQVNHALSGLHVYLFVGGLFVAYAALTFRLRDGMIASFLGGLLCDANMPLSLELSKSAVALAHTHALLFVCAHAVIFRIRDRLPREETFGRVLVALFANLGIFVLFSITHVPRSTAPAQIWSRIIIDLACSQVFLALIAPWFFALQARVLVLTRVERPGLAHAP